jgi:nucleoside 2-deoxyribosyltransferase
MGDSRAIYLAASYSRRDELRQYAAMLEHQGHRITSDWLDGHDLPANATPAQTATLNAEWARRDLQDIDQADMLVMFTGGDNRKRGGRHVELGYALACQLDVMIVGESENIFHYIDRVWHFADFTDFFDWLTKAGDK